MVIYVGSFSNLPRGSLSLNHADSPLCGPWHYSFHPDRSHRSFHPDGSSRSLPPGQKFSFIPPGRKISLIPPGREFCMADVPPSSDISHPEPPVDGRGGRFNFPGQTCPNPLVTLTRTAYPNSLARQTLAIRRIHFRPQSKSNSDNIDDQVS